MKIMDKIRERLRNWLFADELKEFTKAKEDYKKAEKFSWVSEDRYLAAMKIADDCRKMMNSITDVGVDVGFHSVDHSLAVVCIQGRPEYVKFVPLEHRDAGDILRFLKQFEYSNRVVDSPLHFKDMVKDYMMKNPF